MQFNVTIELYKAEIHSGYFILKSMDIFVERKPAPWYAELS